MVKRKLFNDAEGTCTGEFGFVIAVTTIDNIGSGLIQPGERMIETDPDRLCIKSASK
ncbi:unnamed protein product [Toxocara canis]|uniref:DNA-directed RNA polymerase n=1 Tax=Toxocara canis TaxID=6265 RepID=A0A183U6I0_TOXCA|nr:unnamed protein product [Toxocara canis]